MFELGVRMPRKRRASDEINNLRKRWKRSAAKAERLGQTERAHELTKLVQESKYNRQLGRYGTSERGFSSIALEAEGLRGLVEASDTQRRTKAAKSNYAFQQGLRAARHGIPNDATQRTGGAAEMEYAVFALATRDLWEHVTGGSHNQLAVVASQWGVSYQEAYERVLAQNVNALSRIDELQAELDAYDRARKSEGLMSGVLGKEIFADWYRQVSGLVEMMR